MVVKPSQSLQCPCSSTTNVRFKMPKREFFLTAGLLFFIVISIGLLATLLLSIFVFRQGENLCSTKECASSAATLIQSMDLNQDPCTDFYSFVCNGYIRKNPIPDDEISIDNFRAGEYQVSHRLRDLIEKTNTSGDLEAVIKAKMAYSVCLNTTEIDQLGVKPLQDFLQSLGGWPILEGENWSPPSGSSLEDLFATLEKMSLKMELVSISLAPDIRQPHIYRISFDQPDHFDLHTKSLRRRRRDLLELLAGETEMKARTILIQGLVKLLGENDDKTSIDRDIARILLLEKDLEEHFTPRSERKNFTRLYNKMTIKELQQLTNNSLDWLTLVRNIFQGVTNITEDEEIVVAEMDYLKKLPEFMANYSRRAITNYVLWKAVDSLADQFNSDISELLFNYKQQVSNVRQAEARWKLCLAVTTEMFGFAIARMFIDDEMDEKTRQSAEEFITTLRETYRHIIKESSWLDDRTKQTALQKAENMRQFVGYPEWILDDEKLNSHYKDFHPTKDHFSNVIYSSKNQTQQALLKYTKPVDRERWTDLPTIVNAYYEEHSNSIWFPAGILHPPFYTINRLEAMNYGSIGVIIGHEIGHGFDNEGSQYDETGSLRQWWSKKSQDMYYNRTQCYVDQYNDYCMHDGHENENKTCVDGFNTLGENLADNTGMGCAFQAYKQWIKANGNEKRLPGLEEFTPEQLFFISYAQSWCENIRPEQWVNIFTDDPHSPGRYRVQGTLSNFPAFAEAFNCPVGPMNRGNDRCRLW